METLELLKLKLAYNHWANLQALESLRTTEPTSRKATSALMDILLSERLWLARLRNDDTGKVPSDIFRKVPTLGFEALIEESFSNYQALFESLNEVALDALGTYQTMSGEAYNMSTRDALTHVLNQSAFHRGQIAMVVRDEGGEPRASDYASFLRSLAGNGHWRGGESHE